MINDVVLSHFPGTALDSRYFVILDSFSAQNCTCIIAKNKIRDDPHLMLVRVEFDNAMAAPVSSSIVGPSWEAMTAGAMASDGIERH